MLLVITSNIAYASGTEREFTQISILANQKYSELATSRAKETNNQYSYVKIDTFSNNCRSVDVRIATRGLSTDYALATDYTILDRNAGLWLRVDYTKSSVKGQYVVLGARNSTNTTDTGYIKGWVNYE